MQLDEEHALLLNRAQIVDCETHALGDGADRFEEMLALGSTRLGVDDDIGGHNFPNAFLDLVGQFVNLLEAGGAGDTDSGSDEMAISGAADADANNVEHAIHA